MFTNTDNYNSEHANEYVKNVINALNDAVKKLTKAGARRIIIMDLPDLGVTPRFVHSSERPLITAAVLKHNQLLSAKVSSWQREMPEVDFIYADTGGFLQKALDNPSLYGFTNVDDSCISVQLPTLLQASSTSPSPYANNYVLHYAQSLQARPLVPGEGFTANNYQVCGAPQQYLFWDEVHPSTRTHHYLAAEMCQVLKRHGYWTNCQFDLKDSDFIN